MFCHIVVHRRALLAIFLVLSISPKSLSQSLASLRGTLTDVQGAVIPGATVTLTSVETDWVRRAVTNAVGEYSFLQMQPGTYTLKVEKAGFSAMIRSDVRLVVNTATNINVQLSVGARAESITVAAEGAAVSSTDASIGNAYSETQIRQLPLETRNVVALLSLQPGVTTAGEVVGAHRDQNNITLDGVDVNDNQNSGLVTQNQTITTGGYQGSNANGANINPGFNSVIPIPLESVREFRVTVSGVEASQGRSSGGQVVLVTKSGGNQFHGSAYEFHRNTVTAANTWFNNHSGVPRQPLIRNQFGASLGGRIVRDRAFFFVNYEERIDASGVSQARAVPSESMKQGILTFQTTDGAVQTLSPAEVQQVDPLGLGVNFDFLQLLNSYPEGNDPAFGQDGGLNFSGLRFNAPSQRHDHAYVAKLDFKLDSLGKHNLSVRGTLANDSDDQVLQQFPGQEPASHLLDRSKGLAAQYTAVFSSNRINTFTFGFTRLGFQLSGISGTGLFLTGLDSLQNFSARANGRTTPVTNVIDDFAWAKGKHTLVAGINVRVIHNNRFSYSASFPLYGFGPSELVGLGSVINNSVTDFIRQRSGDSTLTLADPISVTNGMGALLGLVNDVFITYQYQRDGNVLPQGIPQKRNFVSHEYSWYVGDTFRVTPALTISYGLRYENFRPPYESNGLQVAPNIGLDQYFAERDLLQGQGIPGNAMPHNTLSYNLSGPVNHAPSWYGSDNNNFAPRIAFAYSPLKNKEGWAGRLFGKSGVLRGGVGVVYDRFGSDLITQFDQVGSIGLAYTYAFSQAAYNFSTSPRFNGSFPPPPPAPPGGFPNTPPDVHAITGQFLGISPHLRTPYAYALNASFARELPGGLIMELGYVGRLSRKLLLQGDVYTPLEHFRDPVSGVTWIDNANKVRDLFDGGLTPSAVASNPALVPTLPFAESIFGDIANFYFPGSASANYFYSVYGEFGGSFLDSLHASDRIVGYYVPGRCLSRTGCFTFFSRQGSAMPTWVNAGTANFSGATLTLNRVFRAGLSFDFNYTLSHSIDNASAPESGAGQLGGVIQNIFDPGEFRGSSDFDIRHIINADAIYQLPFGRAKTLLSHAPAWVDQIVGGWQASSIIRYNTGLPTTAGGDLAWNTNYTLSSLTVLTQPIHPSVGLDENGNPSLFADTSAASSFEDQRPGHTGTRAVLRLPSYLNVDIAAAKVFPLPWEGHRLQFRAELFNAFNHVNFIDPSLSLISPLTFGEFHNTTPARVMQFALRYEF